MMRAVKLEQRVEIEEYVQTLMKPSDVAHELGVSRTMVNFWFDQEVLEGIFTPLGRLITPESLQRWMGIRAAMKEARENRPLSTSDR